MFWSTPAPDARSGGFSTTGGYRSTRTGRADGDSIAPRLAIQELLDVRNPVGSEARDVVMRDFVAGIIDRKYADVQCLVPVSGAEPVVPVGIRCYSKKQQQDRDADIAPHVVMAAGASRSTGCHADPRLR